MEEKRFDPKKLEKLNNPQRYNDFPIDRVIKEANLTDSQVFVDVGAGTGFFSIPFAQKFSDSLIYACDISDVMVNWMQENVNPQHNNIKPLIMDDNSIELDDSIADFVFMVNLHHELDKPEDTIKECARLLKPKGKIAISDWKKEHNGFGPPAEIRIDAATVEKQLLSNGFSNVKIYTDFPNNFLIIAEK